MPGIVPPELKSHRAVTQDMEEGLPLATSLSLSLSLSLSGTIVYCTTFSWYTSTLYHIFQVHESNVPLFAGAPDLLVLVQQCIVSVHCTLFCRYDCQLYHIFKVHKSNLPLFAGAPNLLVLVQQRIVPVFPGTLVHCTTFSDAPYLLVRKCRGAGREREQQRGIQRERGRERERD